MISLLLGLAFWGLTFLFPAISISGFWTIAGVIILFGFFNFLYKATIGQLLIPFRIISLGFLSLVINTGIVHLLAHWFNRFTIEPGSFWAVLLLTFLYTVVLTIFSGSSSSNAR